MSYMTCSSLSSGSDHPGIIHVSWWWWRGW